MASNLCPYCHEPVADSEFAAHCAKHLARRQDGQQADYITLPPVKRFDGELKGVPRVYVHQKCGEGTEMPEEIVRSYLVDPFLYSSDETFCCGCRFHVPIRECRWIETGEDLQTYMERLRSIARRRSEPEDQPPSPVMLDAAGTYAMGASSIGCAIIGAVVALLVILVIFLNFAMG